MGQEIEETLYELDQLRKEVNEWREAWLEMAKKHNAKWYLLREVFAFFQQFIELIKAEEKPEQLELLRKLQAFQALPQKNGKHIGEKWEL